MNDTLTAHFIDDIMSVKINSEKKIYMQQKTHPKFGNKCQ